MLRYIIKLYKFIILGIIFVYFANAFARGSSDHAGLALEVSEILEKNNLVEIKNLQNKGKWSDSISILQPLFVKQPKSIPVVLGLANALTHLGRRQEALAILFEATQWAKGAQKIFFIRRIRVLSRLFLNNKTFQTYQDGLKLILAKKYRNAIERFERSLGDEPENVEVLVRLGQSFILADDSEKALQFLIFAKKLNPFDSEINLWLGRAFQKTGQINDALLEFRIACDGLKKSEQAIFWLAESLVASGQVLGAIRILERDFKIFPFHLLTLISAIKLRLQMPYSESQILWTARKNLQHALSHFTEYQRLTTESEHLLEFGVALNGSPQDIKNEIQRLIQQVGSRFDDSVLKH